MIFTLSGIVLLCILVVVHEFGHFIVAKAFGVRVLTFSVGFGPKLLKWKKGDTEYCLSAIPLGGYVKMLGDSPTDELTDEEKKMSFLHQPFWRKSLIALAGPVFNLVLPIFLFFFMFFGNHTVATPVVGTVFPGQPAAIAGLQSGDRIVKVDGVDIDTYKDFEREIQARPSQKVRLDIERTGAQGSVAQSVIISPEALPDPNPVNIGEKVGHIGSSNLVRRARIAVIDPRSVAAIAGLKTFDEVLSVNGKDVASFDALEAALSSATPPVRVKIKRGEEAKLQTLELVLNKGENPSGALPFDPVVKRYAVLENELNEPGYLSVFEKSRNVIRDLENRQGQLFGMSFVDAVIKSVHEDTPASSVGLKAGDRIVAVDGKAVESWDQILRTLHETPDDMHVLAFISEGQGKITALRLKPAKEKSAFEAEPPKQLGVGTTLGYENFHPGPTKEIYLGVGAALSNAFESTVSLVKVIGKSLYLLATLSVPGSQMAGPLTIFSAAGEAASAGLSNYLWLMALISVNLGILNLLPIPVLDGGHLLMFTIEFVTRRPLTLRTRQVATSIGLAFVLLLMFVALFNDIKRLIT